MTSSLLKHWIWDRGGPPELEIIMGSSPLPWVPDCSNYQIRSPMCLSGYASWSRVLLTPSDSIIQDTSEHYPTNSIWLHVGHARTWVLLTPLGSITLGPPEHCQSACKLQDLLSAVDLSIFKTYQCLGQWFVGPVQVQREKIAWKKTEFKVKWGEYSPDYKLRKSFTRDVTGFN